MIVTVQRVYRCEFCSGRKRKKSFRRHIVARHEVMCFSNPNRTPMPGEVTQHWQTGQWGSDYDYETGAGPSWFPHESMPAWWPGLGMVYTGCKWVPVPGYDAIKDEWPHFEGKPIYEIRPWARRLYLLDIAQQDIPDEVYKQIEEHRQAEDFRETGGW